jgi:3-oxoacyl-[acyl-carrier protein] reductase
MADPLRRLGGSAAGRVVLRRVGLPAPTPLARYEPEAPAIRGPVVLGPGGAGGPVAGAVAEAIKAAGGLIDGGTAQRPAALVFDATGLRGADDLAAVYEFVHARIRSLEPCARVLILGRIPGEAPNPAEAVTAQALEGFTRSLGKELRKGGTCQLVQVAAGAEPCLDSPLRFLLSARSAYISGQVVRIEPAALPRETDWPAPLRGKVAAVTGAARGIGAVVAELLARDGAHVLCLDLPGQAAQLEQVARAIRGSALALDITADGAPEQITGRLRGEHGGVDVFVHNAGITRDRTIAAMERRDWDAVLGVNLRAVERITGALLDPAASGGPALREGGALVCVSSIGGIAGNRGQTNYGASKAGIIGLVRALAPTLRERGARINAVAPGFIETDMTARMPMLVREAGRRMNSLSQGGLPVDVAEAVAWLAAPATAGVTGQVLRVCGQSLLGA